MHSSAFLSLQTLALYCRQEHWRSLTDKSDQSAKSCHHPDPSLDNLGHLTPGFGLLLGQCHPRRLVLGERRAGQASLGGDSRSGTGFFWSCYERKGSGCDGSALGREGFRGGGGDRFGRGRGASARVGFLGNRNWSWTWSGSLVYRFGGGRWNVGFWRHSTGQQVGLRRLSWNWSWRREVSLCLLHCRQSHWKKR